MAQPTAYVPATDFSDWGSAHPGTPHSGALLDAEFDAIQTTTDEVRTNLAVIQRDDTKLANLSVHVEALSIAVRSLISAAGVNITGSWLTSTSYEVMDLVVNNSVAYICVEVHTSGTFATDLAAVKWVSLADSLDALGVSSFVQTLLDDATAGAFLTTLGITAFVQTLLDDTTAGAFLTTLGISSFIQTLLDDSDATTALATLGAIGTDVVLLLDGSNPMAGDIDLGSNKLISVASATADSDAPRYDQVQRRGQTDVATAATIASLAHSGNAEVRLTGSTATTIQGIAAGGNGQRLTIYNVSSAVITFSHQNSSASASDRIITNTSSDQNLIAGGSWTLVYDGTQARWILINETPGSILQEVYSELTTSSAPTTAIPFDNTKPQNTEGTQILSVSITPRLSTSLLVIECRGVCDHSSTNNTSVAIFRDSGADAIVSAVNRGNSATTPRILSAKKVVTSGSTTSTTFTVRVGPDTGTMYINKGTAGDIFNGTLAWTITVREIKA